MLNLPQFRLGSGCTPTVRGSDNFCRPCRTTGPTYNKWRKANAGSEQIDCPHGLEMDKPIPLRGLGDVVERVTQAVGVKSCGGCKARRDKLNNLVPFEANK